MANFVVISGTLSDNDITNVRVFTNRDQRQFGASIQQGADTSTFQTDQVLLSGADNQVISNELTLEISDEAGWVVTRPILITKDLKPPGLKEQKVIDRTIS